MLQGFKMFLAIAVFILFCVGILVGLLYGTNYAVNYVNMENRAKFHDCLQHTTDAEWCFAQLQ